MASEDVLGRKVDLCLTDAVLKLGGGLVIGGLVSILFVKRKKWPILVGSGFGLGMAYSNCEKDLNAALTPGQSTRNIGIKCPPMRNVGLEEQGKDRKERKGNESMIEVDADVCNFKNNSALRGSCTRSCTFSERCSTQSEQRRPSDLPDAASCSHLRSRGCSSRDNSRSMSDTECCNKRQKEENRCPGDEAKPEGRLTRCKENEGKDDEDPCRSVTCPPMEQEEQTESMKPPAEVRWDNPNNGRPDPCKTSSSKVPPQS